MICTIILIIAPLIRWLRYCIWLLRDGIVFLRDHRGTMKQIRFLQKENFLSRLKVAQSSPDEWILDDEELDSRKTFNDKHWDRSISSFSPHTQDTSDGLWSDQNQQSRASEENTDSKAKNTKNMRNTSSILTHSVKKQSTDMTKKEQHTYKMRKNKLMNKAKQHKARGQFDEYEKALIEGMSIDHDHDFMMLLADWYFHSKNFTKALSLLKQILTISPKNHKALWQMAEIHLEKWAYDVAHMLTDKAIGLSPQNPKYYVTMVEILYNTGDIEQAIALMKKVVKLRPTIVSYLLGLASLLEEAGEVDEAKAYYLKVVHIDQSNTLARRKLRRL